MDLTTKFEFRPGWTHARAAQVLNNQMSADWAYDPKAGSCRYALTDPEDVIIARCAIGAFLADDDARRADLSHFTTSHVLSLASRARAAGGADLPLDQTGMEHLQRAHDRCARIESGVLEFTALGERAPRTGRTPAAAMIDWLRECAVEPAGEGPDDLSAFVAAGLGELS